MHLRYQFQNSEITMQRLTALLQLIFILDALITKGVGQDFGYDGTEGPDNWGAKYHQCVGKHQSPINIEEHDVETVDLLPIIYENFDKKADVSVVNTGHTVLFELNSEEKPMITGGPLIGKYAFAQMHFHWGDNDMEGSENRINNNSFPMELHMVFYSASYGSLKAATEHPDGLCVLAFLYSKNDEVNENYTEIINTLPQVAEVDSKAVLVEPLALEDLLTPDKSTYFTYGGSLTTPPCSEIVTWIEYKQTIPLAHQQMDAFRHLNSVHGKLMHNFRPPQPLHGRIIRTNRDINLTTIHYRSSSNTNFISFLVLIINTLVYFVMYTI